MAEVIKFTEIAHTTSANSDTYYLIPILCVGMFEMPRNVLIKGLYERRDPWFYRTQ